MVRQLIEASLRVIQAEEFQIWKAMRCDLYEALDDGFHDREMSQVHSSDVWYCRFIVDQLDNPIGMVELSLRNIVDGCLSSPVPYLEGLYLMSGYRNKGVGQQVMQLLIQWCMDNGHKEFATDTEITNHRAQQFYERLGFAEVDRVVGYKIEL